MQNIDDFRSDFLFRIKTIAEEKSESPVNTFISTVLNRIREALGLKAQVEFCYVNRTRENHFVQMKLDAASIDETTFEINLFLADFNDGEKETLGKDKITNSVKSLCGFFKNALNGAFSSNNGSPEEVIATAIRGNIETINRLHLFIFSTNQISKRIKEFKLPSMKIENQGGRTIDIKLDVIDIERLYSMSEGPEDFEIKVDDFGFNPIPCIKANIDTDQYDAYLAIVPGAFLAALYKEHGAKLLKANVRAILNMVGQVNKGIRDTIRNAPEKFFAYNNGISTTAKSVNFLSQGEALFITSFSGLQIINGGQTTASLALASIKDKTPLDKVFIQMKLTIVKNSEKEFVRNIARYANSQTKVTQTDLNSSHEYYIQLESLSRRIFAPIHSGELRPTKWFFERTKKQYNQPLMTKSKAEQNSYKALYPAKQKITIEDTAKYLNLASMLPYDVAWGAQENAKRFHKRIEKTWDISSDFCDDLYFMCLVGMALLYKKIKDTIGHCGWYIQKKGNLAQITAYTFSKLVYEGEQQGCPVDFILFWQLQQVPEELAQDIEAIAKKVSDMFYDPTAQRTDVREYCKKAECWDECRALPFVFSESAKRILSPVE